MAAASKRIMIVDDEPDIAYLVRFVLTTADFEVTSISDSREAVPRLLAEEHALLVLDLMMPHLDGFEVLAEIRKRPELAGLPVLVLSCRLLTEEETARLSSLSAEVMAKPFETHRFLEKVREMVAG